MYAQHMELFEALDVLNCAKARSFLSRSDELEHFVSDLLVVEVRREVHPAEYQIKIVMKR